MKAAMFRDKGAFERSGRGYELLPFRFLRWNAEEYLLVNEAGEYLFAPGPAVRDLVEGSLDRGLPLYRDLKARHFVHDGEPSVAIDLLATKYRTRKSFLEGFTSLHILVATLRCDHSCQYCQVSRVTEDRTRYDMTEETARRAIDTILRSPSRSLTVEFQGGEPLLNFDLVRFVVEELRLRTASDDRSLQFVIATTLAPLDEAMLAFCREHSILLSTSLDGPESLHNANRPRKGRDSHQLFLRKLELARSWLGSDQVSAIMTTTVKSLSQPREIVDEYVRLGFSSIFLRPISPYGFAARSRGSHLDDTRAFLEFYKTALGRVLEWNRKGTSLVEVYSQILLRKMLTPFPSRYVDLQSPAGTGISAVAYNYDGEVYASDESRMLAEMGDTEFSLGNLHRDRYEEIFGGPKLRSLIAGSITESLPGCSDCAFLPYCGADPLFHYRTQGDPVGHRPTSAFCLKNMEILRHLFGLLRGADRFTESLFVEWATGVTLERARDLS